MAVPSKLKKFNVFGDGNNWLGIVDEMELPKIKKKIEDYIGAGMQAPIPIELGYEIMEGTMTFGGIEKQVISQFASVGIAAVALRFSGAYQRDDTCAVNAVDIHMRGTYTELDPGTAKGNENNQIKISYKLSYLRIVIDGTDALEIDALKPSDPDILKAIGIS